MTNVLALLRMLMALARALDISPLQIAEMYADTDACQDYYNELLDLIGGNSTVVVN